MKILILIAFSFLAQSCTQFDLVRFTNNFEEIAKTNNETPTLSSRILKLREFGECDGNVCPNEVLYITVSEFGEYPEQKLYITPKANEWVFVKWEHIPNLGEENPTIILSLKSKNKKIEKYYRVKVGLEGITYLKIER